MNFKINESTQKLRGGYYTPSKLAHYLCNWVAEKKPKKILEPSCGDGAFIEALASVVSIQTSVTGIELEDAEAQKAKIRSRSFDKITTTITSADFLEWSLNALEYGEKYDAVVGNPPFIRYQYLSEEAQMYSNRIFDKFNLRFTKHTNAWVPFVISSLALLKPGGRMAMVLPAEIMHVLHAQSLRSFLGKTCERIVLIDPEEIWFENTLQGAVLCLVEKKRYADDPTIGLGIISTSGDSFLDSSPSEYFKKTNFINGKTVEGKWTRALLTKSELRLVDGLSAHSAVHKFVDIADVDVGMVTGANKFFLVNNETVKKYNLSQWAHPMFGRSQHCPGVLYNKAQHDSNVNAGLPSNLIWFDVNDESELPPNALDYINAGENDNLHTRYKCRVRKPWFKVPSVYSTSVGMLKRAHNMPRLIYNEMEAYTTDTAYRIRTNKIDAKKIVYCFVNSLTALSSELEGRFYGGGVLELVPSEIERLLIPVPIETKTAIGKLDNLIRTSNAVDTLESQDRNVLGGLGLTSSDILTLHNAWNRLRQRRQRSTSKNKKRMPNST